jgi:hypothetical protein
MICPDACAARTIATRQTTAARLKSGPAGRLDGVFRSITLPDTHVARVLGWHPLKVGLATEARSIKVTRPLPRIVQCPEIGRDVGHSAS